MTSIAVAAFSAAHREVAELRRAIDDDHVVVVRNLVDGSRDAAGKTGRVRVLAVDHRAGRMVFELHEFEVARDQADPVEIGRPDEHRALACVGHRIGWRRRAFHSAPMSNSG